MVVRSPGYSDRCRSGETFATDIFPSRRNLYLSRLFLFAMRNFSHVPPGFFVPVSKTSDWASEVLRACESPHLCRMTMGTLIAGPPSRCCSCARCLHCRCCVLRFFHWNPSLRPPSPNLVCASYASSSDSFCVSSLLFALLVLLKPIPPPAVVWTLGCAMATTLESYRPPLLRLVGC